MPPPKNIIKSFTRFMGRDIVIIVLLLNDSFTSINLERDVVIMFAEIGDAFMSQVFKVPAVKGPAAPLETIIASPAAPVVKTFKSPVEGRRPSKFSKPAQTRFNKKKLKLSNKRKSTDSKSPQIGSALLQRKVQYYKDDTSRPSRTRFSFRDDDVFVYSQRHSQLRKRRRRFLRLQKSGGACRHQNKRNRHR